MENNTVTAKTKLMNLLIYVGGKQFEFEYCSLAHARKIAQYKANEFDSPASIVAAYGFGEYGTVEPRDKSDVRQRQADANCLAWGGQ